MGGGWACDATWVVKLEVGEEGRGRMDFVRTSTVWLEREKRERERWTE